jgi:MFS family permease
MFGISPLFLAPLSEVYGRRNVYILSAVVYTVFQIPQAIAPNISTMLAARLLSGVGGSTAISLVVSCGVELQEGSQLKKVCALAYTQGGTLSDLFSDAERGVPMAIFAFSAFAPTGKCVKTLRS